MTKFAAAQDPLPPRDQDQDTRLRTALQANEIARVAAVGEGLEPTWFDYQAVPAENRGELHEIVATIKASHRRLIAEVIQYGNALLRAKELVGHGNFVRWLQAEFRLSERTARNYMAVAQHFAGKIGNDAVFDVGAAYLLATKSTPADVRDDFLKRAQSGESISKAKVVPAVRARDTPRESIRPPTVSLVGRDRSEPPQTVRLVRHPSEDPKTPSQTYTGADFHLARVKNAAKAAKRGTEALRELATAMEDCTSADIVDLLPSEGNERLLEFLEAVACAMRAKRSLN